MSLPRGECPAFLPRRHDEVCRDHGHGAGLLVAPNAPADVRISVHRWKYICRVVVSIDHGRGAKVIYKGPAHSGFAKTVRGGGGNAVCVQRSRFPERCNSGLTPPSCKLDMHANRTIIFNIQ